MKDEYGIAIFRCESIEARIAVNVTLFFAAKYIVSLFGQFIERLKEMMNVQNDVQDALEFLEDEMLRRFQNEIPITAEQLREEFQQNNMSIGSIYFYVEMMMPYLFETGFSCIWTLLKRINNSLIELDFAKLIAEDSTVEIRESSLIYSLKDPIISFCVSNVDASKIAFATSRHFAEIDSRVSQEYFKVKIH